MAERSPIEATERWLDDVVIGLNLCPFAAKPLSSGRVRFVESRAVDPEAIYRDLLVEVETFLGISPYTAETSLLIISVGLTSFDDYLDLLAAAEVAMSTAGLEGVLQLASFHPDYIFEGADAGDPANYTNRSPYPMFHLLRELGLSAILEEYPGAAAIPQQNIARLRALGLEAMRQRLRDCK